MDLVYKKLKLIEEKKHNLKYIKYVQEDLYQIKYLEEELDNIINIMDNLEFKNIDKQNKINKKREEDEKIDKIINTFTPYMLLYSMNLN